MESLVLRQEITERVLSASLDIDGVNAVIDAEIEQIRSIRSDLQSRRDKAQNIINIASIVTGGAFGAVTSALQFKPGTRGSRQRHWRRWWSWFGRVVDCWNPEAVGLATIAGRLAADACPILWQAARCHGSDSKCVSRRSLVLPKLGNTFPIEWRD